MGLKDKSESLASKMNSITKKLTESLDTADELTVLGDDVIEFVEAKTRDIELMEFNSDDKISPTQVINLNIMVQDFNYVRETLKENTENGRRVLNALTFDLLEEDNEEEKRANLIISFAELNKAVALNMKLYIDSYKEISTILLNIDKVKKVDSQNPKTINTTIITSDAISTVDLIEQLKSKTIEHNPN